MQVELDFRSKIPIYVQIIDQIKHMIAMGVLHPDDQLPTVRQLAADLRVNFNTVARAYRLLDEEGLISTQHGRGTYILPLPSEGNGERLKKEDLEWLTRQYIHEAVQLGYPPEYIRSFLERQLELWERSELPTQQVDKEK